MKKSILLFLFPVISFSMEPGVSQNELQCGFAMNPKYSKRNFFFPDVEAAQTEEGNVLATQYFRQKIPLAMPNGLRFQMARTYLNERAESADLPRIVPTLKAYIHQVIALALSLRGTHLTPGQTGDELTRAMNQVNANINADQEKRENWLALAAALNAYHAERNVVLARVPANRDD